MYSTVTWHFVADTHIPARLEDEVFAYDSVTDEDLDNAGAALLAPCRAGLTGAHPECPTERTRDALAACTRGLRAVMPSRRRSWRAARAPTTPA
jgi:N,N-dimethylformamidase